MNSYAGTMTNPFEFRELMAASVGYDERTVEQVQAEHAARERQRANERKSRGSSRGKSGRGRASVEPAPASSAIPKASMDALTALRTKAGLAK